MHAVSYMLAEFGWFPKEAARPDYGVDLFVETATDDGRPSGRLLAVQIKSGASYLAAGGGTLYVDQAHADYWGGFSIPVVVVLYDPADRVAYWQVVAADTTEETRRGWKITVPPGQTLDAGAVDHLAALAGAKPEPEKAERELSRLRADLSWMQVLDDGGSVVLEANEWINKTSGRADLRLIAHPADGGAAVEGRFVAFLDMQPTADALPGVFPWAAFTSTPTQSLMPTKPSGWPRPGYGTTNRSATSATAKTSRSGRRVVPRPTNSGPRPGRTGRSRSGGSRSASTTSVAPCSRLSAISQRRS